MAESLRDVSYQATNSPDPAYTQLLGALCKAWDAGAGYMAGKACGLTTDGGGISAWAGIRRWHVNADTWHRIEREAGGRAWIHGFLKAAGLPMWRKIQFVRLKKKRGALYRLPSYLPRLLALPVNSRTATLKPTLLCKITYGGINPRRNLHIHGHSSLPNPWLLTEILREFRKVKNQRW